MEDARIEEIAGSLSSPADFASFPELGAGQLSALLIQLEIKRAKKFSFRLRNNMPKIKKLWFSGRSFAEIATDFGLLPMAVAYALRPELGYTKKEFQYMIKSSCEMSVPKREREGMNERVSREIGEACRLDWLHSPRALAYMKEKGQLGELAAEKFLRSHNITKFATEKEQAKTGKTPDFLFSGLEKIPHTEFVAKWFESKATFGNLREVKEDNRTQLSFYTSLFGQGAIVYWLGVSKEAKELLSNANGDKSILVLSGEDLRGDVPELLEHLLKDGLC
jgi:hypothetical protein